MHVQAWSVMQSMCMQDAQDKITAALPRARSLPPGIYGPAALHRVSLIRSHTISPRRRNPAYQVNAPFKNVENLLFTISWHLCLLQCENQRMDHSQACFYQHFINSQVTSCCQFEAATITADRLLLALI